jgi:hypothetical protein
MSILFHIGRAGRRATDQRRSTSPCTVKTKRLFAACAATCLALIFAAPQFATGQVTDQTTSIPLKQRFDDVPLVDAIKNLSRQENFNFIFDPRVPGSTIGPGNRVTCPLITFHSDNLTPRQALLALLKTNNLVMVTNPATTVVRFAPANLRIKPVDANQVSADANGVRDDMGVFDVSLEEAIRTVAQGAGLMISSDAKSFSTRGDLNGKITFRWQKITCRQALAALLDNYDLTMIEDRPTSSARIISKATPEATRHP